MSQTADSAGFLPADHISPAFTELRGTIQQHGDARLLQLADYVDQTWNTSSVWPPSSWTIFKETVHWGYVNRSAAFRTLAFLSKKIKWLKSCWWFHLPMKNYNKQKQMFYSFIQVIPLFDDWFYSHWFRDFNSVQCATHNAWEIFCSLGYILMLYSII